MLTQKEIGLIIKEIASAYQPEKIYLFGSYADGKANEDSDIDLFIIKNTDKRKIERSREVRRYIKDYPLAGIDIIVYTPEELTSGLQQTINIGKEAVTSGRLMYERI
ncbi:MAG: nucleotidyltransferase domain-containing protein [Bacteroidota bacterium]